jgi:hypothetical protein
VAEPTFFAPAPVCPQSSFREGADAWLEQLVDGNPEKVRHPVEVFELHFAAAAENLVQPRRLFVAPAGQRRLIFPPRGEQRLDIPDQ